MTGRRIFSALVLVILLVFIDQSLSQTHRGSRTRISPNRNPARRMTPEQWQREFEQRRLQRQRERERQRARRREQMDKTEEQVRKNLARYKYEPIKKVLKAGDEQWIIIKPMIEKIDKLMSESDVSVKLRTSAGAGSSGGGGSFGGSSSFGSGSLGTGGSFENDSSEADSLFEGDPYEESNSFGDDSSEGSIPFGSHSFEESSSFNSDSFERSFSFGGGFSSPGGSSGGGGVSFGTDTENLNTLNISPDPNIDDESIDVRYFWSWSKPWSRKADDELTEGEKVCKELFELLENEDSKPEDIELKAAELSKIRRQARAKLAEARQKLREAVTPRQEKMLIMTGWLD